MTAQPASRRHTLEALDYRHRAAHTTFAMIQLATVTGSIETVECWVIAAAALALVIWEPEEDKSGGRSQDAAGEWAAVDAYETSSVEGVVAVS